MDRARPDGPADLGAPGFRALGEATPPTEPPAIIQPPRTPAPVIVPPTLAPRTRRRPEGRRQGGQDEHGLQGLDRPQRARGRDGHGHVREGLQAHVADAEEVAGTVSLKPLFAKRAKQGSLKAGAKIRVAVTAPNMIGAVKTLTVRARRAADGRDPVPRAGRHPARRSARLELLALVRGGEGTAGERALELGQHVLGRRARFQPARILERVQRERVAVRAVTLGRARWRPALLARGVQPVLGAGRELAGGGEAGPVATDMPYEVQWMKPPSGASGSSTTSTISTAWRPGPHARPASAACRRRRRCWRRGSPAVLDLRRGELDRVRRGGRVLAAGSSSPPQPVRAAAARSAATSGRRAPTAPQRDCRCPRGPSASARWGCRAGTTRRPGRTGSPTRRP